MRKLIALLLVLMTALTLVAFQNEDEEKPPNRGEDGSELFATLTGGAEVPGPGDPDGSGTADIRPNPAEAEVCFDLSVADIQLPATAAHIHIGSAGFAGPVVVTLAPPDSEGQSSGCVSDLDPGLVRLIHDNPAVFYVNVHNNEFPAGAVRGQLAKD